MQARWSAITWAGGDEAPNQILMVIVYTGQGCQQVNEPGRRSRSLTAVQWIKEWYSAASSATFRFLTDRNYRIICLYCFQPVAVL